MNPKELAEKVISHDIGRDGYCKNCKWHIDAINCLHIKCKDMEQKNYLVLASGWEAQGDLLVKPYPLTIEQTPGEVIKAKLINQFLDPMQRFECWHDYEIVGDEYIVPTGCKTRQVLHPVLSSTDVEKPEIKREFDLKLFTEAISDSVRNQKGGLRLIAKEIGISSSTLSRIINGKMPDVVTLTACIEWLEIDFTMLVKTTYIEKLPSVQPIATNQENTDLLTMQSNLRNELFRRPYNLQLIESFAVKLCDAIIDISESEELLPTNPISEGETIEQICKQYFHELEDLGFKTKSDDVRFWNEGYNLGYNKRAEHENKDVVELTMARIKELDYEEEKEPDIYKVCEIVKSKIELINILNHIKYENITGSK